MADDLRTSNSTSWKAVNIIFRIREKKENLYYEHNDIQSLLGVETSAETTTLISETV